MTLKDKIDIESRLAKVIAQRQHTITTNHSPFPTWTTHQVEEEVLSILVWVLEELEKDE